MTPLGIKDSDALAVHDAHSSRSWSFRELMALGREILAPLGSSRQLIMLLSRNDVPTLAAYAQAHRAGHATCLLDGRATVETNARIIAAYRPRWVIAPTGTAAALAPFGIHANEVHTIESLEVVDCVDPATISLSPELSVLLPTSGTTGNSKMVRLSRSNVDSNAASIGAYLGISPDERPLAWLPFHYSFGLSVLNSHWRAGAPVVVTPSSVVQREFWSAFRDHECTSLAGVPSTYRMLERVKFRGMNLPSLTSMQVAGGPLDRTLAQTYGEHLGGRGGRFFVMYGQTEATARMAYVPPDRLTDKLGSAGVAIPGGRLRTEPFEAQDSDPLGEDAPDGSRTIGEVVYEGPNVMLGYAETSDDLSRGDDLGGVLRTGDLGYLDDDGYLHLVGRTKRIAKVFGLRVNLDDVERRLSEHGPVAVVGGSDELHVFGVFGSDVSLRAIGLDMARQYRLPHQAIKLRQVPSIPQTSSGKTDYGQVRNWATQPQEHSAA